MKTLAEIEKIKDELIEECKRNTFVDGSFTATVNCRDGFDACLALMLEREKVVKDALKAIVEEFEIDWAESQQYAKEALEKLK